MTMGLVVLLARVRAPMAVSPSLTVKATVAGVSSAMLWLAMGVSVGSVLAAPSRLPVLVRMSQVTLESPAGRPESA